MLERVWRKGNTLALLVGIWISVVTMENSMTIPQKLITQLFHFLVFIQRKQNNNKKTNSKRYMHLYIHSSMIYNSQDMETLSAHGYVNR